MCSNKFCKWQGFCFSINFKCHIKKMINSRFSDEENYNSRSQVQKVMERRMNQFLHHHFVNFSKRLTHRSLEGEA